MKTLTNKWLLLFIIALVLASTISLLSSNLPDGLEYSTNQQGLAPNKKQNTKIIAPNYQLASVNSPIKNKIITGLLGTVTVFGSLTLISKLIFHTKGTKPS